MFEDTTYFFSIVIPTYNRADLISRTLNSVLKQSYLNFEIVIVDDGSIDNTQEIILSLNNIKIKYFKTDNSGVAHARNYGIKKATGKYVGFLDSDDLMEPNHLQTAFDFINLNKNPEVIHLNFLWGLEDKSIVHKNKLPPHLPLDIFKNCSLHVNCVFMQNQIAKQNLFNESRNLMFAEDWDFFIKLCVRYKVHLLDKCTSYLIDHEDRSMRNFDENKWIIKRDAIKTSLEEDKLISSKYFANINTVTAHMNSLIAVNFASRKNKIKTLKYWFLSLKQNFFELLTKRSLAITKHLIFRW